MRYTKWRVWFILLAVTAGVIFVLQYAVRGPGVYISSDPVTDTLVIQTYPDLYSALSERSAELLKPYLIHESPQVREQAWRALANTPADTVAPFIELARQQNSDVAWFAISHQDLSANELRKLEEYWTENTELSPGISSVLGRQGDRQSLTFLLQELSNESIAGNYQTALAVARLAMRYPMNENEQIFVIQNAFDAPSDIARTFLYGWYRGAETPLSESARDTLYGRWQQLGVGTRSQIDQSMVRLLKERVIYNMILYYNGENLLDNEIQLSVELAQALSALELNEQNALAAKILLTNRNPHVRITTLNSLSGKLSADGKIAPYIQQEMLPDTQLDPPVWVQALAVATEVDTSLVETYKGRLSDILEENPYLLEDVLSVYEKVESPDQFIQRINSYISGQDTVGTMHAVRKLASFWENKEEEATSDSTVESVREMVFRALEMTDRGVAYAIQPLLRDEELFTPADFKRIHQNLSGFSLPEDIEVFQAFGSLYKDRFEEESESVIDSLSSLAYPPLNRSLSDAGWQVEVPESSSINFRTPNWERLWELGSNPVLRLRTIKGDILIRMNTLQAPTTVSAIDSLSRAGAYDGIPFHRVVPNFVIQGGDVERADGMGGPDFILPTEGTEEDFSRGSVGIASAGRDTEGSQYFIMHQWKPHLNGNYTRFGEVIDGMDVVDRITVGDEVVNTSWY